MQDRKENSSSRKQFRESEINQRKMPPLFLPSIHRQLAGRFGSKLGDRMGAFGTVSISGTHILMDIPNADGTLTVPLSKKNK